MVIAGPAGVGKTRLAVEVLRLAERQDLATARVTATRAASELTFGAMAPLLPSDGSELDRADLLRRFAAALAERAGGRRLVLLVDDAHLLDDASATLVYQLTLTGAALVLTTVRSREAAPEPVVALWKDGILDRLELTGLDGEAMEELLIAVLGGPVDRAAVARVAARCEGNVLFLKELVLGALQAGTLVCDNGLWRLSGPLAPSQRLVELVEARLAGVSEAERALLEAAAVGAPLGTTELTELADLDVAERLERKGLLASRLDGRRLEFRLVHPLHGEVLRTRISPLRRRSLARTLSEAVESTGARREADAVRVATWRLDAGGADPAITLEAAHVARRRYDFALAERLARAAVEAGAGPAAGILAAQVASLSGRGEEAEAELAALAVEVVSDAERALVASIRIDNLRLAARFDDAVRVSLDAEAAITTPAWRDQIAAKRAGLLLDIDGPDACIAATEPLCRSEQPRAVVWACLFSAFALGRAGRLAAADDAVGHGLEADAAVADGPLQSLAAPLLLARAEALTFAGRLEEAEALSRTVYGEAVAGGSLDGQAYSAWQLAKTYLAQGRAATAARYGREAAALLRQLGRRLLLRDCLVPLAGAEALQTSVEAAGAVLAELDALGLPTSHWTGADLLQARAWTAVAAGDLPAARRLLEDAADFGARTGDAVGGVAALHDLARLGRAKDVAVRLAERARAVEGPLASTRAAHAQALARGDPAALEAVAAAFEAFPALVFAAEAAADAAVAWRRRGEPRAAAVAERRSAALADRCEGAVTPALQAIETRALLTPAEREVAMLAAAGRANRDIADQLGLSVRTVENRLHRIYEKLGVSGRPELAAALEV
jgi:ATP/maltotriose-dependent transcriptional regulator MalT